MPKTELMNAEQTLTASAGLSGALESAGVKIVRAMKYHKSFEDCIAEYRREEPFEIIKQADQTAELRIHKSPPIELSILTGEVVYHLRSALDHLFFELVRKNLIGPIPRNVFKNCQFPLYTEVPEAAQGNFPVDRRHIRIPYWVPDRAYTYIESLQPYYRSDRRHHALKMLTKLSNVDKHRHLNTTVTRVNRRETFTSARGFSYTLLHPMLDDGAQINSVFLDPSIDSIFGAYDVQQESEFTPQIAFDEPEIGLPQTALLNEVVYELPLVVFNIFLSFKELLS